MLDIGDKKEKTIINYNNPFGKEVDITSTRILWQETIAAFLVTVIPHVNTANYTYNKILKVNLATDTFEMIKENQMERQDSDFQYTSLTQWFNWFVESGNLYSNDIENFQNFTRIEHIQQKLKQDKKMLICTYRCKSDQGYHWYTMEIVPCSDFSEDNQIVMIYIKDVHNVRRRGFELEEIDIQNQEIIKSLEDLYYAIYVIDLHTGLVNPIRILEEMEEIMYSEILGWDDFLSNIVNRYYHSGFREEVLQKLSLEALRKSLEEGEKKTEFLCRRRLYGSYRYVSATAYFRENSVNRRYVILTMQNVDERIRQEIRSTHNDKRMAAIIKSRFDIINTVCLDTGMCERVYLDSLNELSKVNIDNYDYFFETDIQEVMEEDVEEFQRNLSLKSLRRKAKKAENLEEFIFQYRVNGPFVIWMEAHVIFNCQENNDIVNI